MGEFPKVLYKGSIYRVVHGPEEKANFLADGWTERKDERRTYTVHTAVSESKQSRKELKEEQKEGE